MGYRLDGKEVDIPGKRMAKIGTGKTGDVYKYKNNALKIFKKDMNPPIDLETAQYLTEISTERILLPRNLLFYNQAFRGYTYKLVPKRGFGKRMIALPKEEFVHNVKMVEQDVESLSNKQVLLNGIEPSNCIFNGEWYISDPSQFTRLDMVSTRELEMLNKYQIHMLLTTMILSEVRKLNLGPKVEKQIRELLELRDDTEDSSSFMDSLIGQSESVKQFVHKIR